MRSGLGGAISGRACVSLRLGLWPNLGADKYLYIYIYIERERYIHIHTYIHTYIHWHIIIVYPLALDMS